ncbi:Uracil phosphoribosyltransferase [Tritrichomonas foetus]|uniref:uracil phosphoribosyltransferase n=1 Tax=Tritrichomonas foetus TaxID=1144522 RepID=A0A1J4L0A2_9EUKA|nr:Uracil phosphoribosyltransferase [Tritrichomonas foetus]|eukprot:OHT16891.1 Uracil phosphoribosyltransferase [Tritrichomonas foetus]
MSERLHVINHPVSTRALTQLRDKNASLSEFRDACASVVPCCIYEATKNLELTDKNIVTPLCEMVGKEMKNEVVVIPILRAGISMLAPTLQILPFAKVGYFGMARDEETAIPSTYYQKLPNIEGAHVLLLDPMLATGGSAAYSIEQILKYKPKTLCLCSIVAAPEGCKLLNERFPNVDIYTTALDSHLNEKKYIVPGLGDFGDRFHGTL